MDDFNAKAQAFTDLVLSSSNVVAFTGAGISTDSGIPDYRSPGTGIWEKIDQSVVSIDGFVREPFRYYDYSLEFYAARKAAKPNIAHYLLAELENRGALKGIITQNVDGLHQEAGSGQVHELHGSLRQAVCLDCSALQSMDEAMDRVISGEPPRYVMTVEGFLSQMRCFLERCCPECHWELSLELSRSADLFITIGSSLQVSPANTLPDLALQAGAKLVILNFTPTPFDSDAEILINHQIGEFSSAVMELLNSKNT